jgi:next-to-BRCA1 protein 1
MPDGTPVEPGVKFTKTWRLRNSGQVAWPTGLELIYVSGDLMPLSSTQPIPAASPGNTIDLSVHLQVPVPVW